MHIGGGITTRSGRTAVWGASLRHDSHSSTASARAVLLMLYALRGTPFVFQGEELGLDRALHAESAYDGGII